MSHQKMHTDEVDVDEVLVRRLLAAQFPRWADLPIERVPSPGTVNALFRVGSDLVVRLPLVPGDADIDKERQWLPRLAPLLPVAIPAPLGVGAPAEGYPGPWSVHRWLLGENPAPDSLADPAGLAADLAAFVLAMRRVTLSGGPPAYRGGPLASQDAQTRAAIADLAGTVDQKLATAAWEEALRAPDWAGPPVWVHADLMPGNLLTAGGRLTGVIDFGTVGVGDPACDLIAGWNLLPAGVRDAFRTAVGADDAAWARGRGRALSMALIQLPYYQDTNPELAGNARHVIGEVLAEYAD